MTINESVEDYLGAILMLKEKRVMVRSIDVVHHLNYSKPSISRVISRLRENGYITVDSEGWLDLTEADSAIAEQIYERHRILTDWLIALGVTPEVARTDACRMEHNVSKETFTCIRAQIEETAPGLEL